MYKTKREAATEWVERFNSFPQDMIKELMEYNPDSWMEVTFPTKHDRAYVFDYSEEGEITDYLPDDDSYVIELDDGRIIGLENYEPVYINDFEVLYDDALPMWGTMWQFDEVADEWRLEDEEYIRKMSECGFRIYENEEWGYFFGIDGAGYDFYEEHWIPLYNAWGLHWSLEDKEGELK